MDDMENLQEIFRLYEARYQKAESMGVKEGSKYYPAMKEIECRYITLYFVLEMLHSLKEKCYEEGFRKYCLEFFQMITKEIVSYEVIVNEDGTKEYIVPKVKISRRDTDAVNAYQNAKQAYVSFLEMNYEEDDKNSVCMKISENIFAMLHWMMMAREILFPVNRGKFDNICNR